TQGTYVVNIQHALDFTLARQFSPRLSLSASLPYFSGSWSLPSPRTPVLGPRAQQDALGIGDTVVAARTWVLDPRAHRTANLSVGMGLKVPTGKPDEQDSFPDASGNSNRLRYVDQSVQPGDGGWGITTEIAGFRQLGRVMLFG